MNLSSNLLSTLLGLVAASGLTVLPQKAIAQNTTPYPAEAVEVFTKTCVEQGDSKTISSEAMRQICTCSIEELQKTYSFEQFTQIGNSIGQGKAAPEELNSIVQACVAEVMKK
ncbi:hypothetical protein [Leptolyngbya sp. FACHB-17]|uniref:hypothetical protein n=1 Tax=unclassified Leptolyngbya TaxID=2650499 RepID=UPI0016809C49|nr:hypothetical protein [Leptolyngbya sp. FACHB-17]MBD2081432.1 hypothetical protein [Leptolyngbya sp. FACHB-17]